MSRHLWSALWGVLLSGVISACSCDGGGAPDLTYACEEDAQCEGPDWLCRRGECVRADAGCAAALEICGDGLENDCDELIDCADDECADLSCGPAGRICRAQVCLCPPPGLDGGIAEASCSDGVDDDCDTLIDCDDPDCAGLVCDDTGLVCVGPACACPPQGEDGGITDETECGDGIDNDCDGVRDCADPACDALGCGISGTCGGGICLCAGVTSPESPEVSCSDGQDNDCDGLIDCADPQCLQQACGANGELCTAINTCGCSGNGGTAQPGGETVCDDGHDNDCDGLSDCQDTGCDTRACGLNGQVCQGTTCGCSGNGGTPEPAGEVTCNDGVDNDCDGLTDCQEAACNGDVCGANGLTCAGTSCACGGNGSPPEAAEVTCNDGIDNDCDGQSDCADGNCAGDTCGADGLICSGGSCVCGGGGGPAEPGGETTCDDGHDNDCDGEPDCLDTDCSGDVCGPSGLTCSGPDCVCGGGGGMAEPGGETVCNDFADNDCDGVADCGEPACDTQVCGGNGQTCVGNECVCPGNGGAQEPQGELTCDDGFDNDCDTDVDCADLSNCAGSTCGANGLTCAGGVCSCSGNGSAPEAIEASCNDGIDNDCNGLTDCDDPGCEGNTCGSNGRVCQTVDSTCVCGGNGAPPEATEQTCNDGIDNDCDGVADCADSNCRLEVCGFNSVCCFTGATGCKNLNTDENNCGGCGLDCDSAETCQAGRCGCNNTGDCPVGSGDNQTCNQSVDLCRCTANNQCANGQTCSGEKCSYP